MREAVRLKALQRTPYPMVLARIKLLLEKLQVGGISEVKGASNNGAYSKEVGAQRD